MAFVQGDGDFFFCSQAVAQYGQVGLKQFENHFETTFPWNFWLHVRQAIASFFMSSLTYE
jgi:hypothetical protein